MDTSGLGFVVFIVGFALVIGNMTGAFPTFPFAGFIVTGIGSLLINAGNSFRRKEAEAAMAGLLQDHRYTAAVRMILEDVKREDMTTETTWARATDFLVAQGIPSEEAKKNLLLVLSLHAEAYKQQQARGQVRSVRKHGDRLTDDKRLHTSVKDGRYSL